MQKVVPPATAAEAAAHIVNWSLRPALSAHLEKEVADAAARSFARGDWRRSIEPRILTRFIYPPIPTRSNDWVAYYDGDEKSGKYGYGATEQDAIDDLMDCHPWSDRDER